MATDASVVCEGFTVLPVKVKLNSPCNHYLYLREHNVRETDDRKSKHKTLFVTNVPPYVDQSCLEHLFQCCGSIANVIIQDKPGPFVNHTLEQEAVFERLPPSTRYKVAYVVFRAKMALRAALTLPYSSPRVLYEGGQRPVTGVRKWVSEYKNNLLSENELQEAIDTFMENHDKTVEEDRQREADQAGVPDEDGWITVTKHGKNKGVPRTEVHEKRALSKEKKKREKKELLNFYAFQMRETKRQHIATLRKRFEEDKEKISLMRASRKFRPY